MSIEIRVQGTAAERIRELASTRVESSRSDLVRDAMRDALETIIERNPVKTGQSRAAWVQSLEELGGTAPAGWEGPNPTGIDAGRRQGFLHTADEENVSRSEATNAVNYVSSLEYGTSRRAPYAMVRIALQKVTTRLRDLFRL